MDRWLIVTLLASAATPGAALHAQRPHWIGNLEEARAAARKQDKPIFLVFRCER